MLFPQKICFGFAYVVCHFSWHLSRSRVCKTHETGKDLATRSLDAHANILENCSVVFAGGSAKSAAGRKNHMFKKAIKIIKLFGRLFANSRKIFGRLDS